MEKTKENTKIVYVIVAIFVLSFFYSADEALAWNIERTPTGSSVNSATISITGTDNYSGGQPFCYNKPGSYYYRARLETSAGNKFFPYTQIGNDVTYTATSSSNITVTAVQVGCYDINFIETDFTWTNLSSETYTILAYVPPPEPPASTNIWGSNNGFWGTTTVSDVTTAMTASVQATGMNIYGLLTFVGIPLGFAIAGMLILMINKTLTTPQEKVSMSENDSKKEDFIYHSAEDLEFKRNYGSEEPIKRKRGRPRKIIT